jgi:ketosteroid isomerase-like protein
MRRLGLTALIAFLLAAITEAQNPPRNEAVEKEIQQLDRDFNEARFRNDVAAVNRFLAPDYYQINTGAQRIEAGNRGAGPFNTTPSGDRWKKVEIRDQRVRVYGDTAVSTYVRHIQVEGGEGDLVLTNVWVRRSGMWQLVLSQATQG